LVGAFAFSGLLILGENYNPNSASNEQPPLLSIANDVHIPNLNDDSNNITRALAQKIGQEIANKKPSTEGGIKVSDPEEIVSRYLTEGIKNFNYESLKPIINDSDIKIITNTNRQLTQNYLANLKNIISENFKNLVTEPDKMNPADWNNLIKTYDEAIAELYDLPVPQNLSAIHRQEISLISAQKSIFEFIGNYQTDPLKAWLAITAHQTLNQEFANLSQEINKLL
ncbi:MAG: hypothetical protein Q8Q37_01510, partial [bacterium]|nr:hypothetical protein [bacterium]